MGRYGGWMVPQSKLGFCYQKDGKEKYQMGMGDSKRLADKVNS